MESDSFRGVAETAEVSRIVIVRIATMQRLLGRAHREAGAGVSFDDRGPCISYPIIRPPVGEQQVVNRLSLLRR